MRVRLPQLVDPVRGVVIEILPEGLGQDVRLCAEQPGRAHAQRVQRADEGHEYVYRAGQGVLQLDKVVVVQACQVDCDDLMMLGADLGDDPRAGV